MELVDNNTLRGHTIVVLNRFRDPKQGRVFGTLVFPVGH